MTIEVNLIDDRLPVLVCDDSAKIGGSFYYTPLRPYSPVPMKWAWEQLSRYPKATLIDVGASAGCFTLLATHHPALTVHAFEPVNLAWRILKENVYLNDLEHKVSVNRVGVSNYSGIGVMHVVKAIGGLGVSILDGVPAFHKVCEAVEVEVTRLDDYCLYGANEELKEIVPTLIKADCEGGEKQVLLGALETIKKNKPFLILEISAENTAQYGYAPSETIKIIEDLGYFWTSPEGTDLFCVHRDWESIK